jgi:choline dehydrogenase-like flavoprotein
VAWLAGREHQGDLALDADVVVVGTGAGGSMMARDVAAAGLSVVALEMGARSTSADFNRVEDAMLELLFQERGARATSDLEIRVLQGHGVGGSTVHNTCLCKRTPVEVLEHWAADFGVTGARSADLAAAFERTERELGVTAITDAQLNENNRLFKRGCDVLGWRSGYLNHNRAGCTGAGYCELGCPFDAKQNALKVLLPAAVTDGATVVSDARVDRVATRDGRATGVTGVLVDALGRPKGALTVRAKVVVLAGSAVGSAALHERSGLPDRSGQAGRNLRMHPGAVVAGLFEQEVSGWKGIPQTYECTEWLDYAPGADHRVWLVPVFAHPIGTAAQIPGFGAEHARLMRQYKHVAALTVMVHDESAGRVRVERSGRIRIDYALSQADREQLAFGLEQGAHLLLAAGAREVLVPYENAPFTIRSVRDLGAIRARGLPRYDLPLTAVHPMGTLRMGDDPRRAVVSSSGAHHGVKGLFVSDGSLFPTSIGVPPQISIYTFARHVAPHVIAAARAST